MKSQLSTQLSTRNWIIAGAFALAILIGATTGIGVFVGSKLAQNQNTNSQLMPQIPLNLHAASASRSKSLSMATGQIEERVEGLFVLDHVSGDLQCWVLNPRNGEPIGFYTANVKQDLADEASKSGGGDYVMVTGDFFFDGGSGNEAPGRTVCYVADATSGNVVGYGLLYNQTSINRGKPQRGPLKLLCKGSARGEQTVRDQ